VTIGWSLVARSLSCNVQPIVAQSDDCSHMLCHSMNKRKVQPFWLGSGRSVVVVIPKDWVEGMQIAEGNSLEELEMSYDGEIVLRKVEERTKPRSASR